MRALFIILSLLIPELALANHAPANLALSSHRRDEAANEVDMLAAHRQDIHSRLFARADTKASKSHTKAADSSSKKSPSLPGSGKPASPGQSSSGSNPNKSTGKTGALHKTGGPQSPTASGKAWDKTGNLNKAKEQSKSQQQNQAQKYSKAGKDDKASRAKHNRPSSKKTTQVKSSGSQKANGKAKDKSTKTNTARTKGKTRVDNKASRAGKNQKSDKKSKTQSPNSHGKRKKAKSGTAQGTQAKVNKSNGKKAKTSNSNGQRNQKQNLNASKFKGKKAKGDQFKVRKSNNRNLHVNKANGKKINRNQSKGKKNKSNGANAAQKGKGNNPRKTKGKNAKDKHASEKDWSRGAVCKRSNPNGSCSLPASEELPTSGSPAPTTPQISESRGGESSQSQAGKKAKGKKRWQKLALDAPRPDVTMKKVNQGRTTHFEGTAPQGANPVVSSQLGYYNMDDQKKDNPNLKIPAVAVAMDPKSSNLEVSSSTVGPYEKEEGLPPSHIESNQMKNIYAHCVKAHGDEHGSNGNCAEIKVMDNYFLKNPDKDHIPPESEFSAFGQAKDQGQPVGDPSPRNPCSGSGRTSWGCTQAIEMAKIPQQDRLAFVNEARKKRKADEISQDDMPNIQRRMIRRALGRLDERDPRHGLLKRTLEYIS